MKPLEGVLVVAIEQAVAAPLCSARFAEAGARVIKIERPEGDFARGYDRAACGESSYFTWLNQGKESLCLDFKTEAGALLLRTLLSQTDVFIQNLAPGALDRAGFGIDALKALNPKLIVCDISGYSANTPYANKKAYDLLVQAESGLVSVSGGPKELGRIGVSICDIGAGMTAYAGVLEALYQRQKTGDGAHISVSLFDVAAEWMSVPIMHAAFGDGAPERVGLQHPSIAPYGAFETADKKMLLIAVQNEREWARLCRIVLKTPALTDDQRFSTNTDRVGNRKTLDALIEEITAQLPSATLEKRLKDADIAYGAVNTPDEVLRHPALSRADVIAANGARVWAPAAPIRHEGHDPQKARRAPACGEHTERIMSELAVWRTA